MDVQLFLGPFEAKSGALVENVSRVRENPITFHFCVFDFQKCQSMGGTCPSYATNYGT